MSETRMLYEDKIGQPLNDDFLKEMDQAGIKYRVIRTNGRVTMDYMPYRVNISLDKDEVIRRIYMG